MSMPAEALRPGISLETLFPGVAGVPSLKVQGIASDSRHVGDGHLFLATPGATTHGLGFAAAAIERGAAAIAYDPRGTEGEMETLAVPVFAVDGLAGQLGDVANRFYDTPSAAMSVFGITGTNGKTTVAWMLAECQRRLGARSGYVGTLGAGMRGDIDMLPGMTTPGAVELHGLLAGFRDSNANSAAIEVSSHALDQGRVDGVRFQCAIFTNLSRDHLDYHGNMRDYFEAKARLFTEHDAASKIINLDSDWGTELADRSGSNVVTVSTRFDRVANGRPYAFVRSVVASGDGSDVRFTSSWGDGSFLLRIPGDFNVANAMLVLATLLESGVSVEDASAALAGVEAPPGRLERIAGSGPRVYVDYAHTPDALEVVLRALKPHVGGRLSVVFGAGGDRDPGKRPIMGRVAERLADEIVLTSDNPRHEEPVAIIDAIRAGMLEPERAVVIEDRAAAIAWAIDQADDGDTVLIAGKGHEQYQELGADKRPFSDPVLASGCLAARERGDA